MHVLVHAASAIPFLLTGHYAAAAMCVAPDLVWLPVEAKFRASGFKDWYVWSWTLTDEELIPYRLVHSLLMILCVAALYYPWFGFPWFALGWLTHVCLDIPSHAGVMQPLPLFPFNWRWPNALILPYVLRRNGQARKHD